MGGDFGIDGGPDADNFSRALASLQGPVKRACRENEQWQAKIAAAIYAVLDFAVAEPAAARTLTIDPATRQLDDGRAYQEMIECFAALFDEVAPTDERLPVSSDVAVVGGIAKVVGDHLRSSRHRRLEEMGPELVQFALLPYLGFGEAKRWAERSGAERPGLAR